MQIMLKNSKTEKINIIFIRNQEGLYQNKIISRLAATFPHP